MLAQGVPIRSYFIDDAFERDSLVVGNEEENLDAVVIRHPLQVPFHLLRGFEFFLPHIPSISYLQTRVYRGVSVGAGAGPAAARASEARARRNRKNEKGNMETRFRRARPRRCPGPVRRILCGGRRNAWRRSDCINSSGVLV